jgi:hypothetical protein
VRDAGARLLARRGGDDAGRVGEVPEVGLHPLGRDVQDGEAVADAVQVLDPGVDGLEGVGRGLALRLAAEHLGEAVAGDRRADELHADAVVRRLAGTYSPKRCGMSLAHEEWMSPVSTTGSAGEAAMAVMTSRWSSW